MKTLRLLICLVLLACFTPVFAQTPDERAAARALVKKHGDAVVTLLGTVKTRMLMGGKELPANEEHLETNGTILDGSGLTVVSLTALEPGNLLSGIMSQGMESAGLSSMKIDTKTETTDLRLRLADGKDVPVRIVLRDEDLDLAFVKPLEPLAAPVAFVDGPSGKPAALDLLVGLTRLGPMAGWQVGATFSHVVAVIDKPRTAYLGGVGLGGAVFDGAGRFVGISVMSKRSGGAASMSFASMMSGNMEGMGFMPIVLPADDVRDVARQASVKK
jgi:hypothetical protein